MLRHGSVEDIKKMFEQMRSDTKRMLKEIIQLVYFMRGAIQYDSMMHMTFAERQLIREFIEKRLDDESKKLYQVY